MAPTKQFANPKGATLSDKPGKREQLINEVGNIGLVYLLFKYQAFLVLNRLKTQKTPNKRISYANYAFQSRNFGEPDDIAKIENFPKV